MESNKIRKLYLDFFLSKGHNIVGSSPIVVKDDPTLMFTNAGMNQFKDIFLGNSIPKDLRVANSQKCLRVSGKHNDLEEVGHDTYHHTMFEMLGSWSFGDYFRKDAINWAWEFLTEVCGLDKERLYVTCFEDLDTELEKDKETFDMWANLLPKDRILSGSKKDNFWEMGDVGPCGPCTEIHYDNRTDKERLELKGASLVNQNNPDVIEIWNIVFIQFDRSKAGKLTKLPISHVDTGMGFERLSMIMQGVSSTYDTDIFNNLINHICNKSDYIYGKEEKKDIAIRVIVDHIRAISFSIADGQLPSNVKAGYVIRRILRRAVRYGYNFLEMRSPFLYDLVPVLCNQFKSCFPELISQQDLLINIIKEEEVSFLRTLEAGLRKINQLINTSNSKISAKEIFELYDTFGFPIDLTALILNEKGISFDKEDVNKEMKKQKERSKEASKIEKGDWIELVKDEKEEFVGYNHFESDIIITKYREIKGKDGKQYHLVFNITPFYPEGGGQVGDIGSIKNNVETINILDTKKENNLIIHLADKLPRTLNNTFFAIIDKQRRIATSRNHTSTHLLHFILREFLGDHIVQKGSLVNHSYLRFDFSHFSKINNEDIRSIEQSVNKLILTNISLREHIDLPISKAKEKGAIMLFGEKYTDTVRMIEFGKSKELCGGTHVNSTGEIGLFKILSESSVSSGVRRIEAITGLSALNYINRSESVLNEITGLLKSKEVVISTKQLIFNNKSLEKKITILRKENSVNLKKRLLDLSIDINGVQFIAEEVDLKLEEMKRLSFTFREEKNLLLILGSVVNNKAIVTVLLTDDLISSKGLSAVDIIKVISKEINGNGGGQTFFATAGGDNIKGLLSSFSKARDLLAKI